MRIFGTLLFFQFIILTIPFLSLYGQVKSDTTFLLRPSISNGYQAVFLEKKNSEFHHKVFENFRMDSSELYVKSSSEIADKSDSSTFGEWISIYMHNKKAYSYAPSEPYFNLYLNVMDSLIAFNDFNEGIIPSAIVETKNKNPLQIAYKTESSNSEYSEVVFHFLNKKRNIAVVEFPRSKNRYFLVAKKQYFFNLPIIVNYCPESRCLEWKFDKINFQRLISKKQKKNINKK